jgi:alkylhydroperoxidase/carboxymuconolactone decarboxylase family protein YurZ
MLDNKTRLLVCLGSAVAANCTSCYEYYYNQAQSARLSPAEVKEAATIGEQMKKGAELSLKAHMDNLQDQGQKAGPSCCGPKATCC